jgi:hypothetical protein
MEVTHMRWIISALLNLKGITILLNQTKLQETKIRNPVVSN